MALLAFLKKWVFRLFLIVIALFAVIAAADNSAAVPLVFLGYESWSLPISYWVLFAFVIGTIFGMGVNVWTNFRLRLTARQSTREAAANARALDQARAESLPVVSEQVTGTP